MFYYLIFLGENVSDFYSTTSFNSFPSINLTTFCRYDKFFTCSRISSLSFFSISHFKSFKTNQFYFSINLKCLFYSFKKTIKAFFSIQFCVLSFFSITLISSLYLYSSSKIFSNFTYLFTAQKINNSIPKSSDYNNSKN